MTSETSPEKKKEAGHTVEPSTTTHLRPILIDLGSRSKKAIKDLKRGEGWLLEEVEETLEDVRQSLGGEYTGELLPVLLVYRRKEKTVSGTFPFVSPFSLLK
jgi:hypothetical protein